jgi:hypothetical protein
MNPGLIPPAEVAAAAKRGLELREKFTGAGHRLAPIERRNCRSADRYRCATSSP